jgi:hypothetical protein
MRRSNSLRRRAPKSPTYGVTAASATFGRNQQQRNRRVLAQRLNDAYAPSWLIRQGENAARRI